MRPAYPVGAVLRTAAEVVTFKDRIIDSFQLALVSPLLINEAIELRSVLLLTSQAPASLRLGITGT